MPTLIINRSSWFLAANLKTAGSNAFPTSNAKMNMPTPFARSRSNDIGSNTFGGSFKGEMNARVLQLVVPFMVEVHGSTVDQVDEVMEAIEAAFLTSTRVAALGALGVAYVRPVEKYIPAGEEGGKGFFGVLDMEFMLKRTVTS